MGIENAYYQRTNSHGTGRIELCSTVNDLSPLSTARFFDIVSHETGHSILDALRAYFYGHDSLSPLAAFHEAFGDLSTFFASVRLAKILGHNDQVVTLLRNPSISIKLINSAVTNQLAQTTTSLQSCMIKQSGTTLLPNLSRLSLNPNNYT
ncbi:hypothetical protein IM40_03860 [Candidatus Paracaedimonas acanthamoebae]|nr:hypothetical protein IM40_03860 [Candidatus Paracaedimonas acanthamoebae]